MGHKFVAIVGMAGSGKTEAAFYLKGKGFEYVRFGQIVLDEVMRQGMEINENNERMVREELRKKHGMAALAILNLAKIKEGLEKENVVVDNLQSWEEFEFLKEKFADALIMVAIYASPKTRYHRLSSRVLSKEDTWAVYRKLTPNEARKRDRAELVNVHKGGPIAMADWTIVNEGSKEELFNKIDDFLEKFIYPSTRKPCFSKRG